MDNMDKLHKIERDVYMKNYKLQTTTDRHHLDIWSCYPQLTTMALNEVQSTSTARRHRLHFTVRL